MNSPFSSTVMSTRLLNYRPGVTIVVAGLTILAAKYAANLSAGRMSGALATLAAMPREQAFAYIAVLVVALVVFMVKPFAGALLLLVALPLESMLPSLKLAGALLFAVWFIRRLVRNEPWKPLLSGPYVVVATVFIAYVFASSVWAVNSSAAFRGVIQLSLLFAWSLLFVDLVRSWERAELLAKLLVVSGTVAAVLTLGQSSAGAIRAGNLITGQVNGTALMLLAIMPFAFYLLRGCRGMLWRALGLAFVALAVAAVALTLSRMGLLLLPAVLAILLWQTVRGKRGRALLIPLIALGLFGLARFVPWDRLENRLDTVPQYVETLLRPDNQALSEYSGRGYHIRVAMEIGRDHPIIGAGYNSYGQLFIEEYQYSVPGAPGFWRQYRSPHSSWPGIFADLGVVGLTLWAVVLGVVLTSVWKAWSRTRNRGDVRHHFFVQATIVSFLLYIGPYSLYVPVEKEKLLWALLGLSIALGTLAREPEPGVLPLERGGGRRG